MKDFRFKIKYQDKTTQARVGEITTSHGIIHTPAFVPCGTQATVKSLTPDELKQLKVDLFFVNTYHMMLRPGIEVIKKAGGLHKFMNWRFPIITDSGGFQLFSLGRKKFSKDGKTGRQEDGKTVEPIIIKISDDGVKFQSHWDGSKHELTPEKSMELQWQLGSDIHIAFDDCTPYPVTYKQAKQSMERTHRWAIRSLDKHNKINNLYSSNPDEVVDEKLAMISSRSAKRTSNNNYQALYGVVHGSIFKDLREKSSDFISQLDFDGIAIGGVSVGESKIEMKNVCSWVTSRLPVNKPRHLLGVGEIDDIFEIIEQGIDTFDCVQPTRLGRMGKLFINPTNLTNLFNLTNRFQIDITKKIYADDFNPVNLNCTCYTCRNFTRAYLHHLFKVRELLAYRLASIHNLHFVIDLVCQIRENIFTGNFLQFKNNYLK